MDIFEKIKNYVASHKKVSIAVLVLTLVSAICISSYVLSTNKQTINNEKVTETTKNDSTVKKDDTKTSDEKKSDTKKDDKKEDKKSDEKKSDTKVEETSNTESNTTSTVTETTNNNVSNTTSNNASYTQPTSAPCVPTYTTVNHPEQGHYETQVVSQAWDEPVYEMRAVGAKTGRVYNNLDEFVMQDEDGNYVIKPVQVDTIHHDAVTQQVWVVDQQAWTETVASGC